jgi:hypothetical protein
MPCIFCGHQSVSGAHVLPEWLRSLKVEPEFTLRFAGNARTTRREPKLYDQKVRQVCQEVCNGGWMNRIEDAAKPVITNLVTGQQGELPPQGQALVARWTALAALLSCYLRPPMPVPRDYPATFYGLKEPPAITVVWIATYDLSGGYAESYKRGALPQGWQTHDPLVLPSGTIRPTKFNGYRVTISVWHLAFKVVVLEPPPDWRTHPGRYQVKLDRTIPGVIPIWPMTPGRIIPWPMSPRIDNIGLSALASAMPVITPRQ